MYITLSKIQVNTRKQKFDSFLRIILFNFDHGSIHIGLLFLSPNTFEFHFVKMFSHVSNENRNVVIC